MASKKTFDISLTLSAVDKMTHVINGTVTNAMKKMEAVQKKADAIASASFSMAKQAAAAGVAAGAVLALPVKSAMDFEKGMSNVSTIVDTATESMANMSKEVLGLSTKIPVSLSDLTSGLYDVRSAGISAAEALETLEYSGKLSVAGLSTTKEAANILTSAMNAFRSQGLDVAQISDIVFKTVKAGKTDVSKLSEAFGAVAGTIAAAGVSLQDFQAATAALTTTGMPASQAQNRLRAVIDSLNKPSGDMQKIFDMLAVKTAPELIAKMGSLGGTLEAISNASKNAGMNLASVMGSSEAYGALISLVGEQSKAYVETLKSMNSGISELDAGFSKQMSTFAAQQQVFNNKVSVLNVKTGTLLLPILIDLADKAGNVIDKIVVLTEEYPNLTSTIVIGTAAFAALALSVSAAGFALSGIMTFVTLIPTLSQLSFAVFALQYRWLQFTAFFGKGATMVVAAVRAITAAMVANPILAIIAAIAVSAFLIYTYWEPIKAFVSDLLDVVKFKFNNFMSWLTGSQFFQAGANVVKTIADGIMSGIKFVINAMGKVTEAARAYLPFSPAKEGAFKDLHKVQIVETIAQSVKPAPLLKAMAATTMQAANVSVPQMRGMAAGVMLTAATMSPMAAQALPTPQSNAGGFGGGGVTVNYSPSITISGTATEQDKQEFIAILRKHKGEIVEMVREANEREKRLRF